MFQYNDHSQCGVSTGIHGGLTFGWGELDEYGFWSCPCYTCARKNDAGQKEERARIARQYTSEGWGKRAVRKFIATQEWLWLASWPSQRPTIHNNNVRSAIKAARRMQDTMGLEGAGLPKPILRQMKRRTVLDLLACSKWKGRVI